jgi:DNA-binding GntR family transcriptional regulator
MIASTTDVSDDSQDTGSLADSAYRAIRGRILENKWAPGFQAMELEVAAELGMSRTPVREAMMRLHNEGLVEVVPRRGMRVLPVSPTMMREIYDILGALESTAAEQLARRKPSDEELKPLVDATRDMAAALERDDLDAWARADETFHLHLVTLAGNKLLAEAVFNYWDRSHRARIFSLRLRPRPEHSTQEHMALVEKIRQGDAEGAARENLKHRKRAAAELLDIFDRYRFQHM